MEPHDTRRARRLRGDVWPHWTREADISIVSSHFLQDRIRAWSRPARWVDPGWLFVLVGLAMLASGMLLPAWRENQSLQHQLEHARSAEARIQGRLARSTMMLDQLHTDDEVARRVTRADLNLLDPGDEPILRDLSSPSDVLQWLDASAQQADDLGPLNLASMGPRSTLEIMATGTRRLWFLGAGAMCLCIGLVLGPSNSNKPAQASQVR
ncbi:MAG: hypothetical protein VX527_05215 [Planctomycetota bacterium]|nr:hypothetical protein [Planctomycetota bacterium]